MYLLLWLTSHGSDRRGVAETWERLRTLLSIHHLQGQTREGTRAFLADQGHKNNTRVLVESVPDVHVLMNADGRRWVLQLENVVGEEGSYYLLGR